ncbi:MAG: amidohydrolase family protein [Microlunatus sp.]
MIDTHLHLWRLDTGWYGWNTPALGAVHADSTADSVVSEMGRAGVTSAVVVQAADDLAETDWLLDQVRREPALRGVVGYLPLDDLRVLEETVASYQGAPLVGVRQLWHDHSDAGELAADPTIAALRLLGEAGLPVDVPDAFPRLWPALTTAVAGAPGTVFVLDHCGKPPFGDHRAWTIWEHGFRELVARPNVVVKLSGLFGGSGSAVPATAAELGRVANLVRELAGAGRTVLGSDWPMTRGQCDYPATTCRLTRLLTGWSSAEIVAAETETAQRVYDA